MLLIRQIWVYKRTIFSTTLLPILDQLSVQLISTRRTISSHYLHHSSLATRHFFLLSVATFPLWRGLGGGFFRFPVTTFPLLKIASNNWVCEKGDISPHYLHLFRHYIPPLLGRGTGWGFFFFRLETPFLPFFALLYYIINQLFIYPFYTNRPRFV